MSSQVNRSALICGLTAVLMLGVGLFGTISVSQTYASQSEVSAANKDDLAKTQGPFLRSDLISKTQIEKRYGNTPLLFELNKGQLTDSVRYVMQGKDFRLFLTSTEAVFAWGLSGTSGYNNPPTLEDSLTGTMSFIGSNPFPEIIGLEKAVTISNYYLGNDPGKWITSVPNYGKVMYRNLYPGIDLIYYSNQGQLEFDFVIAPRMDPHLIRFGFKGAIDLKITEEGDLVLFKGANRVRFTKPRAYQNAGGAKRQVHTYYVKREDGSIGIEVGAYDTRRTLIIDPSHIYTAFVGGERDDLGTDTENPLGITVGKCMPGDTQLKCAYITGRTLSIDLPPPRINGLITAETNDLRTGAVFDQGLNPCQTVPPLPANDPSINCPDAFVSKLNADGTVAWTTYIGGHGKDAGQAIAVDEGGNAYITGEAGGLAQTQHSDFPCGLNPNLAIGNSDAFIAKLNRDGAMQYAICVGGSQGDIGSSIALGSCASANMAATCVYITGDTFSHQAQLRSEITPNGFQPNDPNGECGSNCSNGFIAKFDTTGSPQSLYFSYLGGSTDDFGTGITIGPCGANSASCAYITGWTTSGDFPIKNPLAAIVANGSFPAYPGGGTYLGGGCGFFCRGGDAFVTKINPALTGLDSLVYSTFLGGHDFDVGRAIAVDASGNAYVVGQTGFPRRDQQPVGDFPLTTGRPYDRPINPDPNNGHNRGHAFVTKIANSGTNSVTRIVYSTLVQGYYAEIAFGIAVDFRGNTYVTGLTESVEQNRGDRNFPLRGAIYQIPQGVRKTTFITVLGSTGSDVLFSTYWGGEGGLGIAVTSDNDFQGCLCPETAGMAIYIVGRASNPTIFNPPISTPYKGNGDPFVTKIGFCPVAIPAQRATGLIWLIISFLLGLLVSWWLIR